MKQTGETASSFVRRHAPDYQIVLYMGLLMLLGMIVMYAIGPQRANVLNNAYATDYYTGTYFFVKQTASIILALTAFCAVALTPYRLLQQHAGKILIAGFAACTFLFVFGNLFHVEARDLTIKHKRLIVKSRTSKRKKVILR